MPSSHPSPRDAEDRFDQVLADFLETAESGGASDLTPLLDKHPDLAADLAEYMTVVQQIAEYVAALHPPASIPKSQSLPPSFGDYEILAHVGHGGMGSVYKARQKSLNRLVALKMVRSGSPDSEYDFRRFRREAEAVAHLDHPHIVPIFEIGEHEGRPYFSSKLFEGGSLAEHLGEFPETPRRAAEIVEIIARAVEHAHARGILHRDLKPSNILLDDTGRPHVADFGVAKWLDVDRDETLIGMRRCRV